MNNCFREITGLFVSHSVKSANLMLLSEVIVELIKSFKAFLGLFSKLLKGKRTVDLKSF